MKDSHCMISIKQSKVTFMVVLGLNLPPFFQLPLPAQLLARYLGWESADVESSVPTVNSAVKKLCGLIVAFFVEHNYKRHVVGSDDVIRDSKRIAITHFYAIRKPFCVHTHFPCFWFLCTANANYFRCIAAVCRIRCSSRSGAETEHTHTNQQLCSTAVKRKLKERP